MDYRAKKYRNLGLVGCGAGECLQLDSPAWATGWSVMASVDGRDRAWWRGESGGWLEFEVTVVTVGRADQERSLGWTYALGNCCLSEVTQDLGVDEIVRMRRGQGLDRVCCSRTQKRREETFQDGASGQYPSMVE